MKLLLIDFIGNKVEKISGDNKKIKELMDEGFEDRGMQADPGSATLILFRSKGYGK